MQSELFLLFCCCANRLSSSRLAFTQFLSSFFFTSLHCSLKTVSIHITIIWCVTKWRQNEKSRQKEWDGMREVKTQWSSMHRIKIYISVKLSIRNRSTEYEANKFIEIKMAIAQCNTTSLLIFLITTNFYGKFTFDS